MDINVKIATPDLSEALENLAKAITAPLQIGDVNTVIRALGDLQRPVQPQTTPNASIGQVQPVQNIAPVQQQTIPVNTPPAQQIPMQQVPTGPVQPQQQTPVQQPVPTPGQVPTSVPEYTTEQIARAAASLIDAAGNRAAEMQNKLINLLSQFGVQAITQLPKERYGEFALALRQMGAAI